MRLISILSNIFRQRRQLLLILTMSLIIVLVESISLYLLYQTSFRQQQERLIDTVKSQARLIEAVARFDARYSQTTVPGGAAAATLSQVLDAMGRYAGFGKTGEFLLGQQKDKTITFLSSQRHKVAQDHPSASKALRLGDEKAIPMQMALQSKAGVMRARDYRGVMVLAAYDYVAMLNLGLVAKIDLEEIREPFYSTFAFAVLFGLIMIVIGTIIIRKLTKDVVDELVAAQELARYALAEQSEQKELLERIFENTHTLIAYMDVEFNFLRANKAYLAADNKTERELLGKNHFELYPSEENEKIFRQVVASGIAHHSIAKPFEYEYAPDRGVTHWNWSLQPVYEQDEMVGVLLVLLDVTAQIKAQETALQNEKTLRKAQEIGHFGAWDWNIASNELHWSEEVYRIFGQNYGEFPQTYTAFLDVIHQADRARVTDAVNDCLANNKPYDLEHRIIRRDGEIRHVHEKAEIQRDAQGKAVGLKGMVHDITERKKTELELADYRQNLESLVAERTAKLQESMALLKKENDVRRQIETSLILSKDEAEKASRLKTEFLGRMSHELRTPMNAILGFGQLLVMDKLNKEQSDCATEILNAGNHLLDLINEVLDLSTIETGGLQLDMQYVPLSEMVADSLAMVKGMAEAGGIELVNSIDLESAECLYVDRQRFRQVITNLLTNAIKYNKPHGGRVTIDVLHDEHGYVRMRITDTGPGIAADAQELIFEPFNRLGAEYSSIEGTGIGLTIARQLVQLMNCRMGVQSTPGVGSTFWVECPLVNTTKQPLITQQNLSPQMLHKAASPVKRVVLYVEDNPANLRLVQHVAARLEGVTLYSAPNAELGIELACGTKPELILLDINLPGMDGYAALQHLSELPETAHIPVVAISAAAMPRDIERGLKAGFKRYLTKPIQIDELIDLLTEELQDPTAFLRQGA